jgi:hypothetical protein
MHTFFSWSIQQAQFIKEGEKREGEEKQTSTNEFI